MALKIQNLHITVDGKEIVHGFDLEIKPGEVHVVMGPNGSGKSTLANTLMGHPKYNVTAGQILVDETDATALKPDKRAQLGLFLSQQHSPAVAGVTVVNFLRLAKRALIKEQTNPLTFQKELQEKMTSLQIPTDWARRHINVGFSGGEKRRLEILQLLVLNPKYAVLDETDSGLDVDALKIVADGINKFKNADKGILLITHHNHILKYITPDKVHIMSAGKIVKRGGKELAEQIETDGYKDLV